MSSLADLRRVMLNRNHTASIHCRHRVGPAAALRTVTKTKRHTAPSRSTRTGSRRFVARLAIGPTVPGDSRYGLPHEIEIIRVHERCAFGDEFPSQQNIFLAKLVGIDVQLPRDAVNRAFDSPSGLNFSRSAGVTGGHLVGVDATAPD